MYFMFVFLFLCSQLINRLTDLQVNEVFYQSDCELVTFDTVELFFLRKEDIYLYIEQGGRTSHCLSYCHSQEQSCINKNVLKSATSLTRNVHCLDVLSKKWHSCDQRLLQLFYSLFVFSKQTHKTTKTTNTTYM